MLGTAPVLFAGGRTRHWEEVRTLLHPLAVVLIGLFTVALLNAGGLYIAEGGPVLSVLFSLGRIFVLGLFCVRAVIAPALQHRVATQQRSTAAAPLPAWSKPPLAVLGSARLGIGTGLLVRPGFWADFVPWHTDRLDAQALGVWALALGVGVLDARAEDDLTRTRPALLALPGIAATMTVVLAARAAHVDWASGPGGQPRLQGGGPAQRGRERTLPAEAVRRPRD